jgi:hypothetical protein
MKMSTENTESTEFKQDRGIAAPNTFLLFFSSPVISVISVEISVSSSLSVGEP